MAIPLGASLENAADIVFTPAGSIAATNVQAAIEEVASEAGGGGGTGIKVSELSVLAAAGLAVDDLVSVVDISNTSMAASGTNVKYAAEDLAHSLGSMQIKRKTSDQNNSSNTTLADVTDLSWSIVASGIYVVEFYIFHVSAATSTGLVLALNGPASPDRVRYFVHSPTSATATFHGGATAYDTAIIATGVVSTSVPQGTYMHGYVDNGANAGTLTLRMRSEVSGSNATIQEGSWGRLTRVA